MRTTIRAITVMALIVMTAAGSNAQVPADTWRQMAERMGPASRAEADAKTVGAQWGAVERQALLLAVEYANFNHPGDGPAVLAEWLAGQGCVDIRYGFEATPKDEEELEGEP